MPKSNVLHDTCESYPLSRKTARHAMHCIYMQGVLLCSAKMTGKIIVPESIRPHGTRNSHPSSQTTAHAMDATRMQSALLCSAKRTGNNNRAEEQRAAWHVRLITLEPNNRTTRYAPHTNYECKANYCVGQNALATIIVPKSNGPHGTPHSNPWSQTTTRHATHLT